MTRWFDAPGKENTEAVIQQVVERIQRGGIRHVVVATSTGQTGIRLAEALQDISVELICVTHHIGFRGGDQGELDPDLRSTLRHAGAQILTTSHALSGVGRSISTKFGGTTLLEIVAHTLRLFGQGTKVCVEVAIMAADAGLVPTDRDILCVGGSGRGADTAIVLRAAHSNSLFDLRIGETLCRPA